MSTLNRYYLITNRENYGTTVAANGALTYLSAPAGTSDFTPYATQAAFLKDLAIDLQATGGVGPAQLMVFVHGFDTPWTDTSTAKGIQTTAKEWFGNLVSNGFAGVPVAFDWPADAIGPTVAQQFAQAKRMAQQTASESFALLAQVLASARGFTPAALSFVCHSMGNYVMQLGAGAFVHAGKPSINRTLLVAAEIDALSFNAGSGTPTPGADIVSATSGSITVYFDGSDVILAGAAMLDGYIELGFQGPTYDSTLAAAIVAVDASMVNTTETAQAAEPPGTSSSVAIHIGYFWIPVVLSDIATTVMGRTAANRASVSGTNGQGFQMEAGPLNVSGNLGLAAMALPGRAHPKG